MNGQVHVHVNGTSGNVVVSITFPFTERPETELLPAILQDVVDEEAAFLALALSLVDKDLADQGCQVLLNTIREAQEYLRGEARQRE